MTEVVEGVTQLALMPRHGLNAYLVGDVIVDAGLKGSSKKVVSGAGGVAPQAVVLTHAHLDHVGGAKRVCEALGIPLWAGAADAPACESGVQVKPKSILSPLTGALMKWEAVAVGRSLKEGDEVAGFRVLDTPGHSPGHISLWRESDRTLICGDVFLGMSIVTTAPGLHDPPGMATPDPARNRESQRRLAELEPETVLFGHGPPMTGAAAKLAAHVNR
jgi:glyoxylase-like metal-dependent hydrolase (beta-lactamase superfamily II)